MALNYTESVLPVPPSTTLTASGGNISLSAHTLSITTCPSMDYRTIQSVPGGFLPSLVEGLQVYTITPTAANSSDFGIVITQYVPSLGRTVVETLTHTTPSSGATATTICNAWRTQLALMTDIEVTGSGTSTLILTANSGAALFDVVAINSGIAIADSMTSKSVSGITNATPRVATTSTNHGWSTGATVTIAGTATTNIDGNYRITVLTATTFELDGTTNSGAVTGTITATEVAQYSRGQAQDLLDAGVDADLVTTGGTYSSAQFNYNVQAAALAAGQVQVGNNQHTLFVYESATNFADFKTRMNEVLSAYNVSATTTDAETVSMI